MRILIDTQALVWMALGSARLSAAAHRVLTDGATIAFVSAVTAWEYADLNKRGRFGADLPLQSIMTRLRARIIDYPADAWHLAATLPDLHRDPIDRMLIAHAIHADLTLLTADETVRRYPVRSLW